MSKVTEVKLESHVKEVISELDRKLPVILEALGIEAAGNAVDEISKLVYDAPESPDYVRTGRLRNSIAWATHENSGTINTPDEPGDSVTLSTPEESTLYIGTNVEYAPYVELGTYRKGARPFLRNGVANYTDDYKRIIEEGLK